jgi:hypothetical protein
VVDHQNAFMREARTPRAAAVAGIIFALVLAAAVLLLRSAIPTHGDPSEWITQSTRRREVALALGLIPYAGIAFLWFIGVIRARLGDREDKLFATALLGSGLLFVATLFTAAAVMGGILDLYGASPVSNGEVRLAGAVTTTLLATFGVRMAAVFTLVVTNLGRRTGIVPTWLVVVGYACGLVLLLSPFRTVWVTLLFPGWVFLLSVHILVVSLRVSADDRADSWLTKTSSGER